ncbi:MAG: PorT family protein [Chitinophagaceae bacterium]|nr:PorT family protein [Chitinophagaceae bacterium]MCW5925886.1 PorT family protein [Chitinophagaceae bacterium]
MKKSLLTLSTFIFIALSVNAQEDKLVTLGIRAGGSYTNIVGKNMTGHSLDYDYKIGYHAGITADLYVFEGFYLQPALLYSVKGAKNETELTKNTYSVSYIELPLNILLKLSLGNGKLLLGAGPYAAYGIGGSAKSTTGSLTLDRKNKFKNSLTAQDVLDGYNVLKPWDFGANALAGYEFEGGFSFQLNAQLGLSDFYPKNEYLQADKSSLKHFGAGLSVGYKF